MNIRMYTCICELLHTVVSSPRCIFQVTMNHHYLYYQKRWRGAVRVKHLPVPSIRFEVGSYLSKAPAGE